MCNLLRRYDRPGWFLSPRVSALYCPRLPQLPTVTNAATVRATFAVYLSKASLILAGPASRPRIP